MLGMPSRAAPISAIAVRFKRIRGQLKKQGEYRVKRLAVLSVLAVSAVVPGLVSCHRQETDPRVKPELVRLVRPRASSELDHADAFTGVVAARIESALGFRVSGKVTARLVDTGQVVRAGQPLMRIDRVDYMLALNAQTQNVEAARARAKQANSDEQRYRGLVSSGAVSASVYDQIKAQADEAQAQLAAAESQENTARNASDYSVLLADASGVVVETLAEPGQVVAAGQTVVRLAHAGPREASINLPENVHPMIGSLGKATLYTDGQTASNARLRQLSAVADPQTRTYEARYVLAGAAAQAPLGSTVTISIAGNEQSTPTFEVPVAALLDRGHGTGLWIWNGATSTVTFKPVQVVRLGQEEAMIRSADLAGQPIVALGAHLLHEGEKVRVEDREVSR